MSSSNTIDNNEKCPICQECFTSENPHVTTPCQHHYHFTCFLNMTRVSPLCAVCRHEIYETEEYEDEEEEEEEIEVGLEEGQIPNMTQRTLDRIAESLLSVVGTSVGPETREYIETRRNEYNLFLECEEGNYDNVREIISGSDRADELCRSEDDECNTIVHASVLSNNEQLLRYVLIDLEVDPNICNIYGMSPLHIATMSGFKDMITLLLDNGANIDIYDTSRRTPLIIATQNNDIEICKILLQNGALLRQFDSSGDSALHHACRSKFTNIMRLFLSEYNVNVNSVNFFLDTSLHLACKIGSIVCIRLLLEYGADTNVKNKAGKKPSEVIGNEHRYRSRILDILRDNS